MPRLKPKAHPRRCLNSKACASRCTVQPPEPSASGGRAVYVLFTMFESFFGRQDLIRIQEMAWIYEQEDNSIDQSCPFPMPDSVVLIQNRFLMQKTASKRLAVAA